MAQPAAPLRQARDFGSSHLKTQFADLYTTTKSSLGEFKPKLLNALDAQARVKEMLLVAKKWAGVGNDSRFILELEKAREIYRNARELLGNLERQLPLLCASFDQMYSLYTQSTPSDAHVDAKTITPLQKLTEVAYAYLYIESCAATLSTRLESYDKELRCFKIPDQEARGADGSPQETGSSSAAAPPSSAVKASPPSKISLPNTYVGPPTQPPEPPKQEQSETPSVKKIAKTFTQPISAAGGSSSPEPVVPSHTAPVFTTLHLLSGRSMFEKEFVGWYNREIAHIDTMISEVGGALAKGFFLIDLCAKIKSLWLAHLELDETSLRSVQKKLAEEIGPLEKRISEISSLEHSLVEAHDQLTRLAAHSVTPLSLELQFIQVALAARIEALANKGRVYNDPRIPRLRGVLNEASQLIERLVAPEAQTVSA